MDSCPKNGHSSNNVETLKSAVDEGVRRVGCGESTALQELRAIFHNISQAKRDENSEILLPLVGKIPPCEG